MLLEKKLEPDPRIGDLTVRLPPPEVNPAWPQTGGYADHAMHHLTVAEVPKKAWSIQIGEGDVSQRRHQLPRQIELRGCACRHAAGAVEHEIDAAPRVRWTQCTRMRGREPASQFMP